MRTYSRQIAFRFFVLLFSPLSALKNETIATAMLEFFALPACRTGWLKKKITCAKIPEYLFDVSIVTFSFNKVAPYFLLIALLLFSVEKTDAKTGKQRIIMGAERFDQYLEIVKDKNVGLVVNHTSLVGLPGREVHLLDTLLGLKVNVKKIFSPEHGFRGKADAGEHISSEIDAKTGLPIISLYGKNRKPTREDFVDLDIIIFDIQDVGVRFYTYISTMTYVMETAAENNKMVIVLDRPNPNGYYVDGPILQPEYKSFVGLHPVPIVHGMTVGEYAKMVNGEKWLTNEAVCNLTVIPCLNYAHGIFYRLPKKPSPNLPNMTAVRLYPSLCLFEGTAISIGRGTEFPFQVFGHPSFKGQGFRFIPESSEGAKNPKYKGKTCFGVDLSAYRKDDFRSHPKLYLEWLITAYAKFEDKDNFFTGYFNKLAGNSQLKQQIIDGMSEQKIIETWQESLEKFIVLRKQYLLYQDF